jgi:23S rRNA (uridine2552-2'-O)-methyltransferase
MTKTPSGKSRANPSGRSRGKTVNVKTSRGRKPSSTQWLRRQLNDPFVAEAKRLGYRSRAAFKIIWLDDKYNLIKRSRRIVDLGSAPGGWTQVIAARAPKNAEIVAIDILEMDQVEGATFMQMDFMTDEAEAKLLSLINGKVNLVVSDMANSATGHKQTDHLKTMAMCETAFDFAKKTLAPGGAFVAKVLRGGTEGELLADMKKYFKKIHHAKPDSSRSSSTELYLVGLGFTPLQQTDEDQQQ